MTVTGLAPVCADDLGPGTAFAWANARLASALARPGVRVAVQIAGAARRVPPLVRSIHVVDDTCPERTGPLSGTC